MTTYNTLDGESPFVVSHRGASAVRPEHTLEAYRTAIELGSKFIEPDLVTTKDGVLVARHEHTLAGTTDIADHPEFADREWLVENFTLAELKTLRAIERTGDQRPESASYDGMFEIPTLQEILDLVKTHEAETGEKIAIVPELKSGALLLGKGYDTAQMLIDTLVANGFTDPARVFIQSFEDGNLRALHDTIMPAAGVDFDLVQLGNTATPEGLAVIAEYADIVGPSLAAILPRVRLAVPVDGDGDGIAEIRSQLTGEVTDLIANAHALGLKVVPYTVRAEEAYLALNADGSVQTAAQEMAKLIAAGADGFFTDHTDIGLRALRDAMTADATAADDRLAGSDALDIIYGGGGADEIVGAGGDDKLDGGAGDDILAGGQGNDRLSGSDGDDTLTGELGNDRLVGGRGADAMTGGAGDDAYYVDDAGDVVTELEGEGYDQVTAEIDHALAAHVEKLILAGDAVIGTGNALDNRILGNGLANVLSGGAGNDTIEGGAGDDVISGGAGANRVFGGEGADSFRFDAALGGNLTAIQDFAQGEDRIELDASVFAALAEGQLAAEAFGAGKVATSAAQHLLFDQASGLIAYDADGAGGDAAIRIGSVRAGLALTEADFWVV
jgi:glycerophosphoryl diester phosphodiesterase